MEDDLGTDVDKKAAFKQLSSTLENLMQKLDKTEKGINSLPTG